MLLVQGPELKESSTGQSPPVCPAETSGLCSWYAKLLEIACSEYCSGRCWDRPLD